MKDTTLLIICIAIALALLFIVVGVMAVIMSNALTTCVSGVC